MLTVAEVRTALGPQLVTQRAGSVTSFAGITNDSRVAKAGELFVALESETRDGHDFIGAAVASGATGVLAHKEVDVPDGVAVFKVRNTQTALGNLASYWRDRFEVKTCVVTGSVGKTTTKELIAALLGATHQVLKSPSNFNDEVGISMTLLGLTQNHDRAVLEVGMFGLGEIRRLCEIARPEIAVVMNVGPNHMERLGSIEAIAMAKGEAVEALPEQGVAILNGDDPLVRGMRARTRARALTFGLSAEADVRASDVRGHGLGGADFQVTMAGRSANAHSPLPGTDLVHNALAAIAVAVADGMALEEAVGALAVADVPARMQVKTTAAGVTILDDCYNASPASVLAALSVLADTPGRRLALLGDMLELGPAEAEGHERVGRRAALVLEALYTVGPRGAVIAEAAKVAGASQVKHFETKEEALQALRADLLRGDVLLVKASHGMALETVVAGLAG